MKHHDCCEFWVDQYSWECTCGLTHERAPWFDKVEKDHAERIGNKNPGDGSGTRRA